MPSAEYTSAEAAYELVKKNIASIGANNQWTYEQISNAQADALSVYNDVTGLLDTAVDMFLTQTSWITGGETSGERQAKDFWESLYKIASQKWATYPRNTKANSGVLDWLREASKTSAVVLDASKESSAQSVVTGTIVESAGTVADIAETAKDVATDKTTWYVIGGVATLGALLWIRSAFRAIL